jgi:transcriptional regulator with XRE-family HTH domain
MEDFMKLDPLKMRNQRERLGYSQQNVADKSNVNLRTIQRAEGGATIHHESAAQIAATLEMSPHLLSLGSTRVEPTAPLGKTITLRRATSGRSVIDTLDQTVMCKIECDVEPTNDNLHLLKTVATLIEMNMPEPLNQDKICWPPTRTLADRLDLIANLNETIKALDQQGISLFLAVTWLVVYMPDYDYYERGFFWKEIKEATGCRAARIIISDQTPEKMVRTAFIKWPLEIEDDDDDLVPF